MSGTSERDVLEHERANLLDAITELESDIRENEGIEHEQRIYAKYDYTTMYGADFAAKRQRDAQISADRAAERIAAVKVRLALRRRWLRGIEQRLERLAA